MFAAADFVRHTKSIRSSYKKENSVRIGRFLRVLCYNVRKYRKTQGVIVWRYNHGKNYWIRISLQWMN